MYVVVSENSYWVVPNSKPWITYQTGFFLLEQIIIKASRPSSSGRDIFAKLLILWRKPINPN